MVPLTRTSSFNAETIAQPTRTRQRIPLRASSTRCPDGAGHVRAKRAMSFAPGMAHRNDEAPARQGRAGARLGISAIAAHSLCPSLGIANLASPAGFGNGCRYAAKLSRLSGVWVGRANESSTRLPTAIHPGCAFARTVGPPAARTEYRLAMPGSPRRIKISPRSETPDCDGESSIRTSMSITD